MHTRFFQLFFLAGFLGCYFFGTVALAQKDLPLYKLRDAPHILEGMLDPNIDFSVVKLKALYPEADSRRVRAMVEVTDRVFGGPWPDSFIVDEKLLRKYTNGIGNQKLYDYFRIELMVFRAQVDGKTNFGYGIPVFRTDTVSADWSKYLINTSEAEAAVRELADLVYSGYSGEVTIRDQRQRVLAEGTLEEGIAQGVWTYRYFSGQVSSAVLQERKIDYQDSIPRLVFQALKGQLAYQYKTTKLGFKEMTCYGGRCNYLEQSANRQIHKGFSRKDGQLALDDVLEGYLNEDGKLVWDGNEKSYDPESGKLKFYRKWRDGRDVTTPFDLKRRGLKPHKQMGYTCGGGISVLVANKYDSLSGSESSLLRRVVTTHRGDPQYPLGEVVPVDTFYQFRDTHELSSFRIKGKDTSYIFRFDLTRGYGVSKHKDLETAPFSARILYPVFEYSRDGFWPLSTDYNNCIQSDMLTTMQLSNGVRVKSYEMKKKQKHGASVQRYATGQVAAEGKYVNDQAAGEWMFYDWDGRLLLTLNFDKLSKKDSGLALLNAGLWHFVYPTP